MKIALLELVLMCISLTNIRSKLHAYTVPRLHSLAMLALSLLEKDMWSYQLYANIFAKVPRFSHISFDFLCNCVKQLLAWADPFI